MHDIFTGKMSLKPNNEFYIYSKSAENWSSVCLNILRNNFQVVGETLHPCKLMYFDDFLIFVLLVLQEEIKKLTTF